MKSTTNKKRPFSFEDFEKGLMLAGYISPHNDVEVNEREQVYKLERSLAKERGEIYFKRAVLAAEIVNQLHRENTFGRVKFQKLVYLCEHASNMNIQSRYSKLAAGPFDNKFMHTINQEFKKQKWFNVQIIKDGGFSRTVFSPSEKVENYKKYYTQYFNQHHDSIQYLISIFRYHKTRYVELIATIYFCWLEILEKEQECNHENLFETFYSWADEKKKFSRREVIDALGWMYEKGIVPK